MTMTDGVSEAAVEAAARAIYESRNGHGCKPWSRLPTDHKAPYLADARAALLAAALFQRRDVGWQPIETAPKDGGDVLVFCSDTREQFAAFWKHDVWIYAVARNGSLIGCLPTHWQPLPSPPAAIRASADLPQEGGA